MPHEWNLDEYIFGNLVEAADGSWFVEDVEFAVFPDTPGNDAQRK